MKAGIAAWAVLMMAIAVAAIGLEMDRQTRVDNTWADAVPAVFRGQALEALASNAYARGQTEQGRAYARELVLKRPASANGLSLLTQGWLASGRDDQALPALVLAAKRGWRDAFVQALVANSTLQAGDLQTAAQRVIALWRQGYDNPVKQQLTQALLTVPGGTQAFGNIIQRQDTWATSFLVWAFKNGISNSVLDATSQRFAQQGTEIYCSDLAFAIKDLALTGNFDMAQLLWSRLCSGGKPKARSDFAFNPASANGPFDWYYPSTTSMHVSLVENAGGLAVQYTNSDYIRLSVARRITGLGKGQHTIRVDGDFNPGSLGLRVQCYGSDGQSSTILKERFDTPSLAFSVSDSCVAQAISIDAGHGEGTIRRLLIG